MKPREIASQIFRLHSRTSIINLRFYDTAIIPLDENSAEITVTANVQGRATNGGRFSDTEEIIIEAVKQEEEWRFASFEQVEILKR